jgi:ABC-type multidrug transport system ATPase subunit
LKNSREIELERLRLKILDAVRISKRFWMTYRENTFGIASIIDLIYKKSFIKVLFFTNSDVLEKGVPLLKIYTPIEDEIDFSEIIFNPDFDEDGFINPLKIIRRMRSLIRQEFQKRLEILNYEAELIDNKFENFQIKSNPYYREIRISYPNFATKLKIKFEKYPILPSFSFSKSLSRIITERKFNEEEIIRNWDIENPPHVLEIIEKICEIISKQVNLKPLKENSQYLVLNDVSVGEAINNLSFKIHRGKSIGVMYDEEYLNNVDHRLDLLNLFETIAGLQLDFTGSIDIFGNPIKSLSEEEKEKIFLLPPAYDSVITNMKVKKAIQYKINLNEIYKERKNVFNAILKDAGLGQRIDEIIEDLISETTYRFNRKKQFLKNVLEVTGMLNKKNKKFSKLTPLEYLLFSIARALIQAPTIIMFSIPYGILGKFEYEKFNNYIDKIKQEFHVIMIFHGSEEVVLNCDEILTLTKRTSKIGAFKDYLKELPQYGEIVTIELNDPEEELIRKLKEIEEIEVIIEERKNEKYKIFLKSNTNKVIVKITELFGPYLQCFKKSTASIGEYLEFVEYLENK